MPTPLTFWTHQLARWAGLPLPTHGPIRRSQVGSLSRYSHHDTAGPTVLIWITAKTLPVSRLIASLFAGHGFHAIVADSHSTPLDSQTLLTADWFDGRLAAWVWGDIPAEAHWPLPPQSISILFHATETTAAAAYPLAERSTTHLLTSWDAPALTSTITEYMRQLALRRKPFLTVTTRRAARLSFLRTALTDGVQWAAAHVGLLPPPQRRAVRCALKNSREWHEMDFWPPPASLRRIPMLPTALRGVWLSPTLEQACDVIGRPALQLLDTALTSSADNPIELAVMSEGLPAQIIAQFPVTPLTPRHHDTVSTDRLDLSPTAHRLPAGSRLRVTVRHAAAVSDRPLELMLPLIDATALARMREYVPAYQPRQRTETRS